MSDLVGRAYGGESATDRDERRRRQLLDAGLRVFGSTGYRGATVRGLCREAKIADRHFYQYFAQTEDLLLAVYGECIDRLTSPVVQVIGRPEPGSDVRQLASLVLDAFFEVIEDPHLARVVWIEVLGVGPRVEQTYLAAMQQFGELMIEYLRIVDADSTSEPDVEVALLATAAIGGLSHTAMTWYLSDYAMDRRTVVATSALFLSSIVAAASRQ